MPLMIEPLTLLDRQTVEVCQRGACTTEDLDVGRVLATRSASVDGRLALVVAAGRWELTETAVWWRPTGGEAVERLRLDRPGLVTREGDALWIATRRGLFRVTPTDIRSEAAITSSMATGVGDRSVRLEQGVLRASGPEVNSCELPIDGDPRGLAFDGRRVVAYGSELIVADVVQCRVLSALDVPVVGATWDRGELVVKPGILDRAQRIDPATLDVAFVDGMRVATRIVDGEKAPRVVGQGAVWDLATGATRALRGDELTVAGGYLRATGRRVEQLDGTGALVRTWGLGPLTSLEVAGAYGGARMIGDARHLRLLGGRTWTAPAPIVEASLVDEHHAWVRLEDHPADGSTAGAPELIVDLDRGTALPAWSIPKVLHPTTSGSLTLASALHPGPVVLARTADGLQAWAVADGRARGEELPIRPRDALITIDGAFAVTVNDKTVAGWEVATGRVRWSRVVDAEPKLIGVGTTFVDVEVDGERLLLDPNQGATVASFSPQQGLRMAEGGVYAMGDPLARWPARPLHLPPPAVGAAMLDPSLARRVASGPTSARTICPARAPLQAVLGAAGATEALAWLDRLCTQPPSSPAWPEAGVGDRYTPLGLVQWLTALDDGGALVVTESGVGCLDASLRRRWARSARTGRTWRDHLGLSTSASGLLHAWRLADGKWLGAWHAERYEVIRERLWLTRPGGSRIALDPRLHTRERGAVRRRGDTEAYGWTCTAGSCTHAAPVSPPLRVGLAELRLVNGTAVAVRAGRPLWRREGVRFALGIDPTHVLLVTKEQGYALVVDQRGNELGRLGPMDDWATGGGAIWGWTPNEVRRFTIPTHPTIVPSGVVVDASVLAEP